MTSTSSATSRRTARATVIERLRELANDSRKPITLYMNTAGGNVTDGLAIHDAIRFLVTQGMQITVVVQGMAYSMGSIVLQAASPGRRLAFPHSWIMIHEPAKWAGWQSTTAAAQHLDRLKQMQSQIYRILAERSGKPLRQIIRDTKRNDFYLDAVKAKEYGLIDEILGPARLGRRARRSGRARRSRRGARSHRAVGPEPRITTPEPITATAAPAPTDGSARPETAHRASWHAGCEFDPLMESDRAPDRSCARCAPVPGSWAVHDADCRRLSVSDPAGAAAFRGGARRGRARCSSSITPSGR